MRKYVIRRIVISVAILLIILLALFLLLQFMPGSPFNDERLSEDQLALLYRKYGLDQPAIVQFLRYVKNMLTGDFGVSYTISKNTPITMLIGKRLMVSIRIGGIAILWRTAAGLLLGIVAALLRNTIWDTIATIIAVIGVSLPSYVFALGLSYVFGFELHIFPMIFDENAVLHSSILPSISMGMFAMATIERFTRTEMVEVINSDYIQFARSKGVRGARLVFTHILRNSLIPLVTVLAPLVVGLMTGSLVIEKIFSVPGIGSLMVTAIQSNDFNVIIALSFIFSVMYIVIMLIVDILYGIIDPRIRLTKGETHEG